MIEVLKDIGVGLLVGVSGVSLYLLVMWVLFSAPAWAIGTAVGLGIAWCLGSVVRSRH